MSMLPPKKKDWSQGVPQVGVFLRTGQGSTIEMVHDKANNDEQAFAVALIRGLHLLPSKLVMQVRAEVARAAPLVRNGEETSIAKTLASRPVTPPKRKRSSK